MHGDAQQCGAENSPSRPWLAGAFAASDGPWREHRTPRDGRQGADVERSNHGPAPSSLLGHAARCRPATTAAALVLRAERCRRAGRLLCAARERRRDQSKAIVWAHSGKKRLLVADDPPLLHRWPARAQIAGKDSVKFVQGLVTQDVNTILKAVSYFPPLSDPR